MKPSSSSRKRVAAAAAAGTLAAGVLLGTPTQAAPAPPSPDASAPAPSPAVAEYLVDLLGDKAPGMYLDDDGAFVVTVTDDAAAQQVSDQGLKAKRVNRDAKQLRDLRGTLKAMSIPGTSWWVDPVANQVALGYDTTVTDEELETLQDVVDDADGALRLEAMNGDLSALALGGEAIYSSDFRCSLGFNVTNSDRSAFFSVTAGHCTDGSLAKWYTDLPDPSDPDKNLLGLDLDSSFPGDDYGLIWTGSEAQDWSMVTLGDGAVRPIHGHREAHVGESVEQYGSTSGLLSGEVTQVNATAVYRGEDGEDDVVEGLIGTDICSQKGDSGGPLFAGNTALGMTSGGVPLCLFPTTSWSFYQPIGEVLDEYGVEFY
ncbi:S1 family peptidase [Salinispora oceanensis]|uniref:S1 family peptidase n=1 Tax=Salinispora oceanensis TaxID=1050199 RepID=UPI000399A1CB|nr:S1 family peptidase [Salinispora oceanensis]